VNVAVPIWFDALEVGQIEVAMDGSLSLRYADRWLQTGGAFPLSVTKRLGFSYK
jgi:serine/threonine-protein kinase HipA